MITNLHTHTFRCRHASGTEREYIETAIAGGLKRLGFADHAPAVFFDSDRYSGHRMFPEQQEDYVETLLALREEYRGQIDIKIGYELEYYPKYFADFMKLLTRYPLDYLLLGQHFLGNEMDTRFYASQTDDPAVLNRFVDQVIEAMDTGVFTYIAHPDLLRYTGEDQAVSDDAYTRLILAAKAHNLPLEINLLGIRDHRLYPQERFFELCGQFGAPVCMGCDAHHANVTVDPASEAVALDWIARFGCILVEDPVLVPVKF